MAKDIDEQRRELEKRLEELLLRSQEIRNETEALLKKLDRLMREVLGHPGPSVTWVCQPASWLPN